ncbi:MAG: hypothetical protein HY002_16565 [Candidatus Rokubacteria bacterium]|nr:hypothetical protein [Candidatus Rokubacteria bacterium]
MSVPAMLVVNAGLAAVLAGGLVLLLVAVWWSWAGNGIEIPRERWPSRARLAAALGWGLFVGGTLVQVVGHVLHVGVARWPGGTGP